MELIGKIKRILVHLNCILGICFLALVILDWYNPLMGFLTNAVSLTLLVAFSVSSILTAVLGRHHDCSAQRAD